MRLLLRDVSLIVWYGPQIMHEALGRTLKDVRNNSLAMEGLRVLFFTDFRKTQG